MHFLTGVMKEERFLAYVRRNVIRNEKVLEPVHPLGPLEADVVGIRRLDVEARKRGQRVCHVDPFR